MEILWLLGVPLLGGIVLALFGHKRWAFELNALMSLATFIAAAILTIGIINHGPMTAFDEQFFIDSFNVFLVALTAFVGFTTALFSRPYMRIEQHHGKLSANMLRLYHSMYQLFSFTMLLALTTNNMGILWVAMEAATLTTVLLVSLYRTPASLEAAWKYFILCGVGIAQALFGTILLYFAAEKILGAGGSALLWTHLNELKTQLEPTVLSLAFVFLLVGYGTKVGLAPLHNWLPDAHAEGPTPVSAVLSGLLLNVALYAVIRCKMLVDGALATHLAGNLMMGFGLFSMVVAAFFLSRQKDVKRLFAYSSIEHMGLTMFAEYLSVAVAPRGYAVRAEYVARPLDYAVTRPTLFANLELVPRDAAPLIDRGTILMRQTSRLPYDGHRVDDGALNALAAIAAKEGHWLQWSSDHAQVEWMIDLNRFTLFDDLDRAPERTELRRWIRTSAEEAAQKKDGLWSECLRFPGWLLKVFFDEHEKWGRGWRASLCGKMLVAGMHGTRTVAWWSGPFSEPAHWIQAGRVLGRSWLVLASRGIQMHPFGSIITNPTAHARLVDKLGKSADANPLWLLVRMGRSDVPPRAFRLDEPSIFVNAAAPG